MDTKPTPLAGEVWDAFLDPIHGREQAGRRPVLVVSNDWFNSLERSLVIVVPITGTEARVRYQIEIDAGEGGLNKDSTILPEHVRSVDVSRLKRRRGRVAAETLLRARQMVVTLLTD
ncbi:MAG: type II toxin-antitoxin system PemK/MazF family toxin [Thermomicrobiales bacterium]|nr:type II toxin-antitoxin system PemK/MazF family toxin [Thermomicrobiales bacterium]